MNKVFRDYLFAKHILVREDGVSEDNPLETLFSLANLLNIRVTAGAELVSRDMISYAAEMIGTKVPEPFYRGFPDSVRALSTDELLFDQIVHYTVTYGFGNFSEAGHSLLEQQFERAAFKEGAEIKDFIILTEAGAVKRLSGYVTDLLAGTRPVNDSQFAMLTEYIRTYHFPVQSCASKNTAIRLLLTLRDLSFTRFLTLPDIIKVADELNYRLYAKDDVRQMNLRNQDRKFLTAVLDRLLAAPEPDIRSCYEKKAVICGLLHHIHYRAKTPAGREFVEAMRGKGNHSVYALFERKLADGDPIAAMRVLKDGKGNGAVLRNLDYILSRCTSSEQWEQVLSEVDAGNGIILLQLLIKYAGQARHKEAGFRTFRFIRHNLAVSHRETEEEAKKRGTWFGEGLAQYLYERIFAMTRTHFQGKLGKVYIDPAMKTMALPLQEAASQGGYGVLSRGSKLPIKAEKKIRAFTYWEKVNDIDLSAFGLSEDGERIEFSWRTMAEKQSDAILYSGDETSGYKGGSEYFDIDLPEFRRMYPQVRYIVFCDNVFTGTYFSDCVCRGGYMVRDREDSGEIFEPKTVQSSFSVNCESTFAYLFGIDLRDNTFVWMNMANRGSSIVAGDNEMSHLIDTFHITEVMNLYDFFEMAASAVTEDPAEADIIVSDTVSSESGDVIRSYDFEKIMKYMQ